MDDVWWHEQTAEQAGGMVKGPTQDDGCSKYREIRLAHDKGFLRESEDNELEMGRQGAIWCNVRVSSPSQNPRLS